MSERWVRVAAPLAALCYPALVALGPAVWPPLLALSLASPAIALWASLRLASARVPIARAVALLAIGAPALYSLLGGLFDFQHALPLTSVRVWIPLWISLVVVAWSSPTLSVASAASARSPSRLAIAHGVTALPIIVFALAHIANHVAGIAGGDIHAAMMTVLRGVYRHPAIEPFLLACICVQVLTGIVLAARRLVRRATAIETLQLAAGAYLGLFFASHLTAVLRARSRGGDTNWAWLTSSDLFRDAWSARLVPYYALAVLALAIHLACAVRAVAVGHGARAQSWAWLIPSAFALGAAAAGVILIGLA